MFCTDEFSLSIYSSLYLGLFSSEAPTLLYYSHITAIIVSLLVGFFVFFNNKKSLPARILLTISIAFSAISVIDIFLWTQIDARIIMFLWSFWLTIFIFIFILSFYFLCTFITKRDMSLSYKLLALSVLFLIEFFSSTRFNLESFDNVYCNATEGAYMINVVFSIAFLILIATIIFGVIKIIKLSKNTERKPVILATIGIGLFLLMFSVATYIASILNIFFINDENVFFVEQYGYFGMTIFIASLAYIIVEYKAFNVKLIAAKALVVTLVILTGSQLLFVKNTTSQVLSIITLIIVAIFGYFLVKSVKREIEAKEHIQKLAEELELANNQQVTLIHFITHQVKGFFTKSRNIFAGLTEGDFGPIPKEIEPIIQEGFDSDTKAVETVQDILNAANIRKGTVSYEKKDVDLTALVKTVAEKFQKAIEDRGLDLHLQVSDGVVVVGDQEQLTHAIRNLIDNSIKYTREGSISVHLSKQSDKIVFSVKDTGVGITPEDMQKLFTEGGRGKNAQKINVESTGFGLYIVKNIVEKHSGKIRAESDGEGKGSEFVVELPIK